jgi:hypothetical protein
MRRTVIAALTALAIGSAFAVPADAAAPLPTPSKYGTAKGFQLVGHTNLGKRGMNSPIAVAGSCVYVGDRGSRNGIAVVDVRNPAKPKQVGTIKPQAGSTQRELRADEGLGILVVMAYSTSGVGSTAGNYLKVYDIRSCARPVLLSTLDFGPRSPHEFFLWKDPKKPGRALAYVTFTIYAPDLVVYDLTDPKQPAIASAFDLGADAARPFGAFDSSGGYLHSLSVSDDGTRAYMGTWDYGLYVADTSTLAAGTPGAVVPIGAPATYLGNVHGGVKVPGKPYAVLVQEGYAGVFTPGVATSGCPFGWLRMVDLSVENAPRLTGGEFKLRENDCATSQKLNGTFSSHNQTVFPDVALVPWYGGGLRAVDISNPAAPVESGAFVPKPSFVPDYNRVARDERLYFNKTAPYKGVMPWTGAMWSYPVVRNGLVYVVDIDLGLYVLRYTGKHAKEVSQAAFVEGNSAPARYTKKAPVIRRPAGFADGPATYVRDRYADLPLPKGLAKYGFVCAL